LLQGYVAVEQDHFGQSIWRSGDSVAFATEHALSTGHRAMDRNALSAVFMQIEPDAAEEILGRAALENLPMGEAQNGRLFADIGRTITSQMMNCHLQGSARRLYITGKAMEFIAHVVDLAESQTTRIKARQCWTSREIAQFQQAREILLARLHNPPTVAELARLVGTNSRKLGAGFNDLFGMPVYAFVKGQRLDTAKVMLESGETSVAIVAHRLGYQPQHFATEFKRRFGMPPSQFAGKRS
jgi:AraC family transcriptional regulator, transcriptional activator of the genes for pyochelin and ferripyochelin receptors